MYIYVYISVYIHIYIHIYVYISVYICVYIQIYTHIYTYICVYICIYMYTHSPPLTLITIPECQNITKLCVAMVAYFHFILEQKYRSIILSCT